MVSTHCRGRRLGIFRHHYRYYTTPVRFQRSNAFHFRHIRCNSRSLNTMCIESVIGHCIVGSLSASFRHTESTLVRKSREQASAETVRLANAKFETGFSLKG
jgi:hypothetical protein